MILFCVILFQYLYPKNEKYLSYSVILAAVSIPLVLITLQDFIAPLWIFASKALYQQDLGLAHHCPFCLLKRWWSMLLYIVLIWLGLASTGWQLIVRYSAQQEITIQEFSDSTINSLRKISIISICTAIFILFSHLLVFAVLRIP